MQKAIDDILAIAPLTVAGTYLAEARSELVRDGIAAAVAYHDSSALFDWLMEVVSFQGIGDAIAAQYIDEHGTVCFSEMEDALRSSPACPRLQSYWHFEDCRFAKNAHTCSEPN